MVNGYFYFKNTKIQLFGINASHLNIHNVQNLPTCVELDSEDMNINYFGAYDVCF